MHGSIVFSARAAAERAMEKASVAVVLTVTVTQSSTRLPKVRASELTGRAWLNTGGRGVALADLRGKVVVLDFWTF